MKRLLFTPGFPPMIGGQAHYMYSRCIAEPDNLVVLAASQKGDSEFDVRQTFDIHRFKYAIYPPKWMPQFLEPLRQLLKLLQSFYVLWIFLKTDDYHVCEISTPFPGALAIKLLFPRRKFKLISYALGDDIIRPQRHKYSSRIFRKALENVDLFVAISHYTKSILIKAGVPEEKIVIIFPTINRSIYSQIGNGCKFRKLFPDVELIILTVCRLSWKKGVDQIIRIMPSLIKKFPSIMYLIGGVGPYEENLVALTKELKLSKYVRFLGRIEDEDLVDLYSASDVFVMPTREDPDTGSVEGFGIVFLEAGSQGVPVIGPRQGGSQDAILDGVSGFLVTPDMLSEIEERLLLLLGDKDLRVMMGQAGRARALKDSDWSPLFSI